MGVSFRSESPGLRAVDHRFPVAVHSTGKDPVLFCGHLSQGKSAWAVTLLRACAMEGGAGLTHDSWGHAGMREWHWDGGRAWNTSAAV